MGNFEDIDLSKANIDKHTVILKAGTPVYRAMIGSYDPKIPTAQENRCAKNPNSVTPEQYQKAFFDGKSVACGTGNIFASIFSGTCLEEIKKRFGINKLKLAVVHKIVFKTDIPCIDTISLCLSAGVDPTPGEDNPFWHYFYGPPVRAQALKIRSSVDPSGENIVFFPDNIPDYLNIVRSEPSLDGQEEVR